MRGVIEFWNDEKGFGFIRRDGGNDVFCHIKAVFSSDGVEWTPKTGNAVEFEIEIDPRTERTRAAKVYLVGGRK